MISNSAPIGVFDSGLGGLSVLEALRRRLPDESIIYLADSRYAPYGEKTNEFIRERSAALAKWLVEQGAKMLVVACNTATTHAIASLRDQLKVPIVGVEPGIKPSVLVSVTGIVGVLATAATLRSEKLRDLLSYYSGHCSFICQAGHGLVELIEQGDINSPDISTLLQKYLVPMILAGADTVVLGSTHFALLAPHIKHLFGDQLELIETGTAIARRAYDLLTKSGVKAEEGSNTFLRFCSTTTDSQQIALMKLANRLLSIECQVHAVRIGGDCER
ncbi:glutamate racemase [Pseudomonas sp. EL_65y_Pfl2_R96]|uniref:glutamate racemase n=1 Tax=Pseudomonas sp. EL_65y_Pfl2_R96 TaxID=3088699 RepID=UPI0030DB4C58